MKFYLLNTKAYKNEIERELEREEADLNLFEPKVLEKDIRDYQIQVHETAKQDRANGNKRGLILLPTGLGKTHVAFLDAFSVMDQVWKSNDLENKSKNQKSKEAAFVYCA